MRPAIFWRQDLEVVPRYRDRRIETVQDARIQEIFKLLTNDDARTDAIAAEIEAAYRAGRKVLVLTERTEHLTAIQKALADKDVEPFVLHGRMSKKQRSTFISPPFLFDTSNLLCSRDSSHIISWTNSVQLRNLISKIEPT